MQKCIIGILLGWVLILVPFFPAGALVDREIKQQLAETAAKADEVARRIEGLEEDVRRTADEVRLAQEAFETGGRGFLSRSLTLDRLRKARRDHHEKSEQLKRSRIQLSQGLRQARQRIADYNSGIDKEIQALDEQLAQAQGEQARQLKKEKARWQQKKEAFQALVDETLTPYAELIQGSPWEKAPPFRGTSVPFGPMAMPGPPPEEPPDDDHDRQQHTARGMMIQFHRREMEQMQNRIRKLEKQVEQLQAELEDLKSRTK